MISIQYSDNSFVAKRFKETPVETAETFKFVNFSIDSVIDEDVIESYMGLLMRRFDAEKTPNSPTAGDATIELWLKSESDKLYIMVSRDVKNTRVEKVLNAIVFTIYRAYDFFPGDKESIINDLYQSKNPECVKTIDKVCENCMTEFLPLLKKVWLKSPDSALNIANKIHKQHHANANQQPRYRSVIFEIKILNIILQTWDIEHNVRFRANTIMPMFKTTACKVQVAGIIALFHDTVDDEERAKLLRRIRHLVVQSKLN